MKLIIEIPDESTKSNIQVMLNEINDFLTVNKVVNVLDGNELQIKTNKRDGNFLIKIYRNGMKISEGK
jgi:hypothetical protein